ncbi:MULTISPECIES: NAD(P)H-dependent flavin oxidoreductase [Nocardia]|uniref:NAD(P)H-dependent flavin oxidoreductase n=1 Tax=Nocardia TaxID=1817 RepID=UPI000D689068|nr:MULTISPECIES: nitronate monooxygenase [Nocardia]
MSSPAEQPSTPWSKAWGLRVPVVNAPMGGVAGGRLAAAVTAAGGLGLIGMGSAGSVAALRHELPFTASLGGRFGIGLVGWVLDAEPELLDVAIEAGPALITVGFADDSGWVDRVASAGIRTAAQVYNADDARRAEDAGIDVVVARGLEGGGHGAPDMTTLPLLDAVLKAVSVPVLAAGGIGSPASLAAVLAAGASGAWLGTRLAACSESLLRDAGRRAMIAADGSDTVLTSVFDIAMELPWPTRFPARVLRNEFTDRWAGDEDTLRTDGEARNSVRAAAESVDPRIAPIDAGQGVGMITSVESARDVVTEMCSGAAELLTGPSPT